MCSAGRGFRAGFLCEKQVFVVKKQGKEELTVLDTFPEDNARQNAH
jgi:hypothetical protein